MKRSNHTQLNPFKSNQKGFTLVELMISLSILSLILVLTTYVILQIGKIYTKGANTATTQNTARNIVNTVASQLQLGGATPVYVPAETNVAEAPQSNAGAICIGNQRFSFVLNHQLSKASNDHVLWKDIMTSSGSCIPISPLDGTSTNPTDFYNTSVPNNGREIMPLNTRLVDFHIRENKGIYTITAGVVYGDSDLFTYSPRVGDVPAKANCKGGEGSSFCAVSILTKTVVPRLIK